MSLLNTYLKSILRSIVKGRNISHTKLKKIYKKCQKHQSELLLSAYASIGIGYIVQGIEFDDSK